MVGEKKGQATISSVLQTKKVTQFESKSQIRCLCFTLRKPECPSSTSFFHF